ncbi:MAG: sodium-independent anion transporter [Lysobacterales bacterium 69-70]|nr:MAG: sodium-independent anion transporter [Xanthomonadaceae bacterium SCN 69-320]ODV20638.1 MAG: sodium-independent anion transporter [Xanthomonadaceae bacterium SCN 69-25]OJZ01003.1 MAG: sodium-independent anion transporter [Xanthomonadales bacterium 69-70]
MLQRLRPIYEPQLCSVLRGGYVLADLRRDLVAGLTVAVVALPLAMALAIASGTTPDKGLHTAIVAGFLISLFGGSRVQVGGPTAAFIPVVFAVIERFGYGGLILCTLLAGFMLIGAGLLRLGALMKYIPQPVVTGFTAGIAVSIFSSQIKDLLGLRMDAVPAEFFARWQAYLQHASSFAPTTAALAAGCLVAIVALRRWRPSWPGFLLVVAAAAAISSLLALPVDTIATRFGGIPSALPQFEVPHIPFERTVELFPSAFTIAFLAGVESLLSAVVADGMTGGRHRSNGELVAQGVANIGSALFGGLPATGAIARTAVNIRSGGRSPVAGMAHALFLLLFMLVLAPLMGYVPLATLAAVLLVVAWQMSDLESFRHLLKGPVGDRAVLLVTFALTVMFDLTVAIEVGLVLAAFLFMHRMSEVVELQSEVSLLEEDRDGTDEPDQRAQLPPGVEAFQISGPLFFAVANRLDEVLDQFPQPPAVFILRLRLVPLIDASGVTALSQFLSRCERRGTRVILSGLREQPRRVLAQMHVAPDGRQLRFADNFAAAIALCRTSAPDAATG